MIAGTTAFTGKPVDLSDRWLPVPWWVCQLPQLNLPERLVLALLLDQEVSSSAPRLLTDDFIHARFGWSRRKGYLTLKSLEAKNLVRFSYIRRKGLKGQLRMVELNVRKTDKLRGKATVNLNRFWRWDYSLVTSDLSMREAAALCVIRAFAESCQTLSCNQLQRLVNVGEATEARIVRKLIELELIEVSYMSRKAQPRRVSRQFTVTPTGFEILKRRVTTTTQQDYSQNLVNSTRGDLVNSEPDELADFPMLEDDDFYFTQPEPCIKNEGGRAIPCIKNEGGRPDSMYQNCGSYILLESNKQKEKPINDVRTCPDDGVGRSSSFLTRENKDVSQTIEKKVNADRKEGRADSSTKKDRKVNADKIEAHVEPSTKKDRKIEDIAVPTEACADPFAEVEKAQPETLRKAAAAPTAADIERGKKFYRILKRYGRRPANLKAATLTQGFQALRKVDGVLEAEIDKLLAWYLDHFEDQFVPKVYSSQAFREKWNQLSDALRNYEREHPAWDDHGDIRRKLDLYKEEFQIPSHLKDKFDAFFFHCVKNEQSWRKAYYKHLADFPQRYRPHGLESTFFVAQGPYAVRVTDYIHETMERLRGLTKFRGDLIELAWKPDCEWETRRLVERGVLCIEFVNSFRRQVREVLNYAYQEKEVN